MKHSYSSRYIRRYAPLLALLLPVTLSMTACSGRKSQSNGSATAGESSSNRSDLASCCTNGDLSGVAALVNADNINGSADQTPPLHLAAQAGHADVVEFLIKKGADINKADGYGRFPIHCAASGGKLDVIRLLLSAGARADQESGPPILDKQRMDVAAQLQDFSASDRLLPIHSAAEANQPEAVKFFIGAGIPANAKDGTGSDVLDHAVSKTGWSEERATLIRLLDADGSFERTSKECLSTDGFYTAEVTMRNDSNPTQVFVRFMPEVREIDTQLNQAFSVRRMLVSLGAQGETDPGSVSKWLTPENKAAIAQGTLLIGRYRIMGKMGVYAEFLGGDFSALRAQRENGLLEVSILSTQESFFPGNGDSKIPTASYRMVRWK